MNNIPGLIDVFESEVYTLTKYLEDKDMEIIHGHRFNKMIKALTRTISILKSIDSGGKLVPEEKEIHQLLWDSSSLGSIYCTKVAKAIHSKLLINRAAFLERLPMEIQKFNSKKEYPCVDCDKRIFVGHKIDCLCERVGDWYDDIAKKIASEL